MAVFLHLLMMQPSDYKTLTPSQAIAYQHELRKSIEIKSLQKDIHLIGGADISFNKNEDTVYAGIIILSYPDMKVVNEVTVIAETTFPYISGLLAFREIPALLDAWNPLALKPDVMVLDGQGIAHERRLGIATHFGLLTGVPSIGCAKSRLAGNYTEPANLMFAESELVSRGETVGLVLRTKINCKPVFISPGHHITIAQSAKIIKSCTKKHRIPEPTRLAHLLVNAARIKAGKDSRQLGLF